MAATTDPNGGKPRATIRDVASAAGVSIATVSRVLNGRRDVAPKTREAVLKAVHDFDFATNRNARALSGGRTGLVGVTVPIVEAAYFSVILSGNRRGALRAGHADRALPHPAPARARGDAARPADARHHRRRGADVAGGVEQGAEGAQAPGPPVRRRRPPDPARRRDPGDLGRPRDRRARRDRAPARAGPPPDRGDHGPAHLDGEHRAARRLPLPRWPPQASSPTRSSSSRRASRSRAATLPRGRFSTSPTGRPRSSPSTTTSRSACSQAARARGLRVPEDLSVVGFDDSEHSAIVSPALTTVRQPLAEMGRMAVSLLLRLLENQSVESHAHRARDATRRAGLDCPRAGLCLNPPGSKPRRTGMRRVAVLLIALALLLAGCGGGGSDQPAGTGGTTTTKPSVGY